MRKRIAVRGSRILACAGRARLACQGTGRPLAVAVTRRHLRYNVFHERWPGIFFEIILQHRFVQAQLGHQLVEPRVFIGEVA
jgi:hypothetical protein